MFYGLWRYWRHAKKELLIFGTAFGVLFAFIILLGMAVSGGAFSQGSQNIYAVGILNPSGSLSHTSAYVSKKLDQVSNVRRRLIWAQNTNNVEIAGKGQQLNVVYTNSQYITMLNPKFLNGTQRYHCQPECVLQGAAIASELGNSPSIKVGGQHYEVTAIFDQNSFEFPDGERPDIILDVSQFGLASSFNQLFTMFSAQYDNISPSQFAEFMPVFRTVLGLSSDHNFAEVEAQARKLYEEQKYLFTDIRRVISLKGSDDKTLGLIQGKFFDQKAKDNMLLMKFLFLIAAIQLFLVTLVNLISVLTRFNLVRAQENSTRYALGGNNWSIFFNNIYFIQPVMIIAAFLGLVFLWILHGVSFHTLRVHLNVDLPSLSYLFFAFAGFMVIVSLCFPAIINLKILLTGLKAQKASLTRSTILKVRSLNVLLFVLATTCVFLSISTYSHWLVLKKRGTENIIANPNMINIEYDGKGMVNSQWESIVRSLAQKITGIGFLSTLPGDRNLSFKSLQFNDEKCQAVFDGWENRFYGHPFKTITGQALNVSDWGLGDIAISESVLEVCGFDASEIIGKYIQQGEDNLYQVRAVVKDIPYDLHVATPQRVIYPRETVLSNFRSMVFPEYIELTDISDELQQAFEEYNLQMRIKTSGSLEAFIGSKLIRETTTMIICFVLMGLALIVLFLAFTQHITKVLLLRNREWGTMRAMGANKKWLSRLLVKELLHEWLIALFLAFVFALLYTFLQPRLLIVSVSGALFTVLIAASIVLVIAIYYVIGQFFKQCRLTPANLLKSES
ncbi:ABC transporter permease [Pseudoalteromonas sp. L1]|uniref:ABC transporter permease n=1 Tax=Pseudoalteromonas sp. L1 TaxID=195716 RepID=UPI001F3443B3|nr:ABC transporter permease [Pseudoalteromonas sp. L1]